MTCLTHCADEQQLRHFSLGLGIDAEAEALEEHLRSCPACVTRLQALSASDTLTDAMRAQTLILDRPAVDDRVQRLMEDAKRLRRDAPASQHEESLAFLAPPQEAGDLGALGTYRIRKLLGVGGMGIVYEAVDSKLQRTVALKVLRPQLAALPASRERFLREARAAASLNHDNIVPIYEVGEAAGLPFLAMQLLTGESLEARLRREKRLPTADIIAIGRLVALGLAAAHVRGLVHRDIKPANVWLEAQGWPSLGLQRIKILDFGLVRAVSEGSNLTQSGQIVGTPEYMAPEQADGQAVDARADLFSLGSVLYAMAAGVPPFQASSTLAVLRAVCDKAPVALRELNPEIPGWLADVIAKLLAKNPADRFQSAGDVVQALERQVPSVASRPNHTGRAVRVHWAIAASLLIALAGLGLAEATGVTQLRQFFVAGDPSLNVTGVQNPQPAPQVAAQKGQDPAPAPVAVAQEEKKPAIVAAALFPFEERGAGVKEFGAKVTDLLFAKLATRPELFLVDRADLKKTLAEQELNLSGAVNTDQATKVGQLTGAKLLISGSVLQIDKKTYLVAKVIGTETSRVVGVSVDGKASDELGPLVEQLADKVAEAIAKQGDSLIAKAAPVQDRIAAVKQQLKQAERPSVWVQVTERHVGAPAVDPAAQTEILRFLKETGFVVIDTEEGSKGKANILLKGEGLSETAARHGNLVSVRARVELKAVDRQSGKVIAADRQTVLVVDLSEQIAGKSALQEAAAILAERVLPKLVRADKE